MSNTPAFMKYFVAVFFGAVFAIVLEPFAIAAGTNWVVIWVGGTLLFLTGQLVNHYHQPTNTPN